MGLVRFVKELTNAEFQSIEQKSDETLYFISDTLKIFLGGVEYGGKAPEVSETASIALDNTSALTGDFVLSSEEGNSLSNANGLWAPPKGSSRLEDAIEDNFVAVDQAGSLKDSQRSLTLEVADDSSVLPSAAATFRSLEEIELFWDDEEPDDEDLSLLAPRDDSSWMDYTHCISFNSDIFADTGKSSLHANNEWVRIHLDAISSTQNTLIDYVIAELSGTLFGSLTRLIFTASFYQAAPDLSSMHYAATGGIYIEGDIIRMSSSVITDEIGTIISADLMYPLKSATFPNALF